MNKYILEVEGMRCGMCEMHVEDNVRKNMNIKKAKASRFKNNLVVISEENFVEEDFKKALESTGYQIKGFEKTEAKRKLFGWR